jgi:signal peptidase II
MSVTRVVVNRMWFLSIALGGCLADLATKHVVFAWRGVPRPSNEWWIVEGYIGVETALNKGALFGMGASIGPQGFAVLSLIAAAGLVGWVLFGRVAKDRFLALTLGCILGGILGNLYDRLGLWSHPDIDGPWRYAVRDWILFRYGQWTWPNFNLADCFLVCGAALLVWHSFRTELPRTEAGDGEKANG